MDTLESQHQEIETLRARLAEAREALEAIRTGGVDALVVNQDGKDQVFTLSGADQPYRVMVEAINEGAATLSLDGLILWSNACLAEMLKQPLEMLLGSNLAGFVAPTDQAAFNASLKQARDGKHKVEITLQASDEAQVPVLLSFSPLHDPQSETRLCVIATDLTEQKRNIKIAAAERVANAILDQAVEPIIVCTRDGKISRASQAAYQLASQNPLFQPFEEAFPLRVHPGSTPFSIQAVLQGEIFQGVEASLDFDPGSGEKQELSLLVSATPLRISGDGNLGCVITLTDLTESKRIELEIREYAVHLERSNKDLQDFAFITSHDLQEPLRKIQAFGKSLTDNYSQALQQEGCDYIERMQNAAFRMEKMINDLLDYSRIATKAHPFEPVDLNEIVADVLSDLEIRLAQVDGKVQHEPLPRLEADRLHMHQLFQNLISNALKFHKPGLPPQVTISAEQIGDQFEIQVRDNGIGFSMDYAERIFQPFQRLHGRSEYEGNGIGLAICRKIAEHHHGRLTVSSAPNQGATFYIRLPLHQR